MIFELSRPSERGKQDKNLRLESAIFKIIMKIQG